MKGTMNTNPMVSDVSRYEDAARAADASLNAMFAAFGIVGRKAVSVGGAYIPGTEVGVREASVRRGEPWSVRKADGCIARLYVGRGDAEECVGTVESARLRDEFGHVGIVVDVTQCMEHWNEFVLVVLTGMLEQK